MTMIEKIAAAMRSTSGGQPFTWENAARAALDVMREPSEDDINACRMEPTPRDLKFWQAMIDAALAAPHHLADRMG